MKAECSSHIGPGTARRPEPEEAAVNSPQENAAAIPPEQRERTPLLTEEGYAALKAMLQHPAAPRWNYQVGDRLTADDLPALADFRARVFSQRPAGGPVPEEALRRRIEEWRATVPLVGRHVPAGTDLVREWPYLSTMERDDLVRRPEALLPAGADLSRLIVYDTSGTTGHAVRVPHHPLANAMGLVLLEWLLQQYGIRLETGPGRTAAINVCAQARTVTFATAFTAWGQSRFAKVNLHPADWPDRAAARRFFREMDPQLVTGDPVSFAEMVRWEIRPRPRALISTALELTPALRRHLADWFGCPVIDTYATTETGPVAYACPKGNGWHLLPPDLFVEAVDADGRPRPPGERGELAVTGGRNPYLALVRYRTGDFGRVDPAPCPCGDPAPRILDLQGRRPVFFRATDGSVINAVDVGRVLREFVFVRHRFVQCADGRCEVTLQPLAGHELDAAAIRARLRELFGPDSVVEVRLADKLPDGPGGKVLPYRSELDLR
jgi:phenylacetate-CoA ligase